MMLYKRVRVSLVKKEDVIGYSVKELSGVPG
jgi:hypothetical protein